MGDDDIQYHVGMTQGAPQKTALDVIDAELQRLHSLLTADRQYNGRSVDASVRDWAMVRVASLQDGLFSGNDEDKKDG